MLFKYLKRPSFFCCFFLLGSLFFSQLFSCTVILVTKSASQTGSVILAHTDDGNFEDDKRIVFVPGKDYPPGAKRAIAYTGIGFPRYNGLERGPNYEYLPQYPKTPIYGEIEQTNHTYSYFDGNYAIVNEEGVAIAESTCACKFKYPPSACRLLDITELTRLALERAKTAKQACKIIGSLAEAYGYSDWGEMLVIADKNEGWVLEICASPECTGALWVAKKVPDGEVFVGANEFRIRSISPNDPDLIYGKNLFQIAEKNNWLNHDGSFDWLLSVSPGEFYHPYHCLRRIWRVQSKLAPSLYFCPWVENGYSKAFAFSLKPDKKLALQDIFSLLRDYYQDTPFDLSKQPIASGPFGCPYRYKGPYDPQMNIPGAVKKPIFGAWERPISIYSCNYSHVVELRSYLPKPLAYVVWIGFDQPLACCYMPFYVGVQNLPKSFSKKTSFTFYAESAFWPFNFVSNLASQKFSYMIKEIQKKQKKEETEQIQKIKQIEKKAIELYWQDPELMREFITDFCLKNSENIIKKWWQLGFYLFEKYANGSINIPKPIKEIGYPDHWLKNANWINGPISYQKQAYDKGR